MTNGEKFKEIFQISQVDEGELYAYVWLPNHDEAEISIDWWNADYKEPTPKNDLAVDCISRADAIQAIQEKAKKLTNEDTINGLCGAVAILFELSSVTQQEPFKPMVEIDLDYVIKQKYIEREVLDKIRAEIDNALSDGMIHKKTVLGIIDKYKAVAKEK